MYGRVVVRSLFPDHGQLRVVTRRVAPLYATGRFATAGRENLPEEVRRRTLLVS